MFRTQLCCAIALLAVPAHAASPSFYAGQETREIKALSPQDISDYLSGKGMGFAKAAELNGYPGPAHVLELAAQLDLTPEQKFKTEALFKKMQVRAVALGREIVDEERTLDHLFATRKANPENLRQSLDRIGRLHGQVRQVHLVAHVAQAALLTPAQLATYNLHRGYAMSGGHQAHENRPH